MSFFTFENDKIFFPREFSVSFYGHIRGEIFFVFISDKIIALLFIIDTVLFENVH